MESGDLRRIYRTQLGVVKIPIAKAKIVSRLIKKEIEILTDFSKADFKFPLYFPKIYDTIDETIVTGYEQKLYSLSQILKKPLNPRHVVWMLKRMMTAIGFAHNQGWVHGAINPDHIMYGPSNHSGVLTGWIHATRPKEKIEVIPSKYKAIYPKWAKDGATPRLDSYLLSKCFNIDMPNRMKGFLKGIESCDNIWDAISDLDDLAKREYGSPKFIELNMEN